MAYRADIEIAVKGAQELQRLQKEISATSKLVDGLNNYLENIGNGGIVRSINNLNNVVAQAAATFNSAALGTKEATIAARQYIQANDDLNKGLQERIALLEQIKTEARNAAFASAGIRPATQYAGEIGPGAASPVALSSQLRGRTEQILAERTGATELSNILQNLAEKERQLENSKLDQKAAAIQRALDEEAAAAQECANQIEKLNERQADFMQRTDAAAAAARRQTAEWYKQQRLLRELQQGAPASTVELGPGGAGFSGGFTASQRQQANEQAILDLRQKENKIRRENLSIASREELFEMRLGRILEKNAALEKQRSRTREATSNAIIGGAFPLLFGQGVGAAAGGGIGGFAGGLAGGQMGFGLSLAGTALGSTFDEAAKKSIDFAQALRGNGDAVQALEALIGNLDETTKTYVGNLQLSGQTAAAADASFKTLSDTVGRENAKALQNAGDGWSGFGKKAITTLTAITAEVIRTFKEVEKAYPQRGGFSIASFIGKLAIQGEQKPQTTAALTPEAQQRVSNLQKETEILRTQAVLNSTSLKNNLDQFVTISKRLIIQERLKKEAEIEFQFKRGQLTAQERILSLESARLTQQAALNQLERQRTDEIVRKQEEIARKAEQRYQAQLNGAKAIFDEQLKLVDINIREQEVFVGQEASLRRSLQLSEARARITEQALSIERDLALQEAKKNGTTQQTLKLYDLKLKNAQYLLNIEDAITEQRIAQSQVDQFVQIQTAVQTAVKPLQDLKREQELQEASAQRYYQLLSQGILPTEAKRIAEFDSAVAQQQYILATQISIVEATLQEAINRGATADFIDKQVKALEALKAAQQGLTVEAARGPGKAAAKATPAQTIQDAYGKAAEKLQELTDVGNIVAKSANMIGEAFGQAFQDIATGSASAQEALGNMMKSIGENFINMAAQIIAQQTTMIILGGIMKALGLTMGGSGGGTSIGGFAVPDLGKYSFGGFGGGSITKPFASGGFVTGPTQAIVGEGGQPEYIIPASKMQAAMSRYASGARGASVIPDSGNAGTSMDNTVLGGNAASGTVDVRYTVERINSVDYVTADQFQLGLRQAAQQGAAQGEQRTLRRLQQSRSTRSRLGMV